MNEACDASRPEPLIVDLKAHDRANLEEAMHDGVAVVSYDCKSLRVLHECKLEGTYGFMGVSLKEEIVQLVDSDEIKANLPGTGAFLAGKLDAKLASGASFDIAMVMIGKRRTTVSNVDTQRLHGSCAGATHFVRGAFIGAFATKLGTRAQISATVSVFGAGGSMDSESSRIAHNRDGDRDACFKADPANTNAPPGCGALLRLELAPIAGAVAVGPKDAPPEKQACPSGLLLVGGKCTTNVGPKPHQCDPANVAECEAQCNSGHGGSCASFATAIRFGKGVAQSDDRALALTTKACDLGHMMACAFLGYAYGAAFHAPLDRARAVSFSKRACDGGDEGGCSNLGISYLNGEGGLPKDPAKADELFRRACDGGDPGGCINLAIPLKKTNPPKAFGLFKRACDGGPHECSGLAECYRDGIGVARDTAKAEQLYQRACDSPHVNGVVSCLALGEMYELATNGKKDLALARKYYDIACMNKLPLACQKLEKLDTPAP